MNKNFIKERIYYMRAEKNISARKLSLELGQSTEYINQIENGRSIPSIEALSNICDYFGITLGEFFDERQMFPLQYKTLIEELNRLNLHELDIVIELVKLITNNKPQ